MKKIYNDMQNFIDDVHEEININEIIIDLGIIQKDDFHGQFLNCLFHEGDNSPSLQITENFFKCYGCGAKGDIFKFLQLYYNIDFIESVKKLAEFLNIEIKSIKYNFDSKYDKLKQEWEMYLNNMKNAPINIQKLSRDYFPQEIGYDKEINYIVLPITSKTGAILGFTKRRIGDECLEYSKYKRPKWKHSSLKDSLIGQAHNIFNLHNAIADIRKKRFVIATEGPKDVIAYRRIGFNNTICTCGTSNSSNIWDLFLPLVDEIILSMDLDKAGIEATIKTAIYLSSLFDISKVYSVILQKGQDPYDVVVESHDLLLSYFNDKINVVDFAIKYGTLSDIKELYDNVLEYNKVYVIKKVCENKGFNIKEAESWLGLDELAINKNKNNLSEKDRLLAIINCEDLDEISNIKNPMEEVERAKRILELKYGIKGDRK